MPQVKVKKAKKTRQAKKTPPAKQMKPKRNKRSVGVPFSTSKLTECAQKYALALMDPADPQCIGACVPTIPPLPSQKARGYNKFPLTIGTNGWGFVNLLHTVCNDGPAAYYSTATFAGTAVTGAYVNDATMGVAYLSNLPYTYTQTNTVVFTRIVAVGVRIQYVGTKLNESGLVHGLHSPNHTGLHTLSSTQLAAYSECVVQRVANVSPLWINSYPITATETAYSLSPWPWNVGSQGAFPANGTFAGGLAALPLTTIMVTGVAGQQFYVELFTHVEHTGLQTQSMVTRSHGDVQGLSRVLEIAQQVPVAQVEDANCPPICAFMRIMKDTASEMVPKGIGFMLGPAAEAAAKTVIRVIRS